MTEDILRRIEQAIGCQKCGKALRPNGPSSDFCGEDCQNAWHAARRTQADQAESWASQHSVAYRQQISHAMAESARRRWPASAVERAAPQVRADIADRLDQVAMSASAPITVEVDLPRGWLAKFFGRMFGGGPL